MPVTSAMRAVRQSESLEQLRDLLRGTVGRELSDQEWTSLPVFGGQRPRSTSEVWSWDPGRLLIGTCADDLQIVDRETCGTGSCPRPVYAAGKCEPHYRRARRASRAKGPIRDPDAPALRRLSIRLAPSTLKALGKRPGIRAREVLDEWAQRLYGLRTM